MKRIALGDGRWFNAESATLYQEGTQWDGHNYASVATGTQWDHESLWHTAGEAWVMHAWSDWQGSGEAYNVVSASEAARWLIRNNLDLPPTLVQTGAELEV